MKKSKTYNFIIPLIIYPFDIMVSIGETNEQFIKSLTRNLPSSSIEDLREDPLLFNLPTTSRGRTVHLLTGGQTIIRLSNKPITAEQYGTLAHEIFHAVEFLMTHLKMELCNSNDEAYAYLIGYLTQEIYKRIK